MGLLAYHGKRLARHLGADTRDAEPASPEGREAQMAKSWLPDLNGVKISSVLAELLLSFRDDILSYSS